MPPKVPFARRRGNRRPPRVRPVIEWLEARLAPATGVISGMLWNDANANGVLDTGEPPLAGRTVFLDQNQDGVLDNGELSTTAAADGSYSFTGLAPGTYYVTQALPAGWKQTAPAAGAERVVTLTSSTTHAFTFNNLATTTDTTLGPYHEAGFTFSTSVQNQPNDEFRVFGSSDTARYAGAPALTDEWAPTTISLTQDNGAPFAINSIDLSTIWNSIYYPTVTFTGHRADGSLVTQSFQLSNNLGFQTETFSGFTNIVSLTWNSTNTSDYHQFRNVSVTIPGTSSVSGVNFGSVMSNVPTAVADNYTTPENATLTVAAPGLLANDTDPNGLPLTSVVASTTAHGTLTVNADGSLTYVPNINFYGTDTFNYYVTDGQASSTAVSDTITVTRVYQPPVARDDSYTLVQDTPLATVAGQTFLTMSSQPGDYIGQGLNYNFTPATSTFSASIMTPGTYANTVNIGVSGPGSQWWYLYFQGPNLTLPTVGTYDGAMRWPFESSGSPGLDVDGDGRGSNTLTGQFTVKQAVYDSSGDVLAFDATFVQHSEGATPALTGEVAYDASGGLPEGVLFNDSDPNGLPLTAKLATGPSHGSVVLNADGSFTYTPAAGYYGTDSFTYAANDGQLSSNIATVHLTVDGHPTAANQAYATSEGQPLTVAKAAGLLTGASDPNGLPLAAGLVAGPSHGAVTVNPDGSFTYMPTTGFYGTDTFTYDTSDGQATSKPATVTLTVNAPPVASDASYTVQENRTLTVAAPGLLASASDPDGDALSAALVSGPADGSLTLNANGTFAYQPVLGFSGTDSFTYRVNDGTLDSNVATVTIQVTPLPSTTTTLSFEGPSPVEFGLTVKLDATVLPNAQGAGTPTGAVTFYDGATALGTVTLNANGFAQLPVSALAVGTHTLSARYNGDTNDEGSASNTFGETVVPDPTMISIGSSSQTVVVGLPVTFRSTVVNVVTPAAIPTGTITFSDGTTVLGTVPVDSSGGASLTTSALGVGAHTITASYNGDPDDAGSVSSLSQTVGQDTTTTSLVSSATPSVVGQAVTITATVAGATPADGTPTGSVTFSDGATVLGTVPLVNGSAALATSSLALGSHSITATYGGDTLHQGSASPSVSQSVGQDSTTTTLSSSANPSVFTGDVTLTATVTVRSPGAGTPGGSVTFWYGGQALGTQGVGTNGQASLTFNKLPVGTDAITAVYSGDGNDQGSASAALSQVVGRQSTTTTLSSSTATPVVGQSVTFTVQVLAVAPSFGLATGAVTFYDGTSVLGTATLNGGYASLSTALAGPGSHGITAVYGGDSSSLGSTSSGLTEAVGRDATSISLASSGSPSYAGQAVTFTAAVTLVYPGAGTPTGTVTFSDGATVLGSAPLDAAGRASFTTSALAAGSRNITAAYGGDASDQGSTSAALAQAVNLNATTTIVSSSAAPSVVGQSVTFTASVVLSSPWVGAATPSGTVTFYDGSKAIGTAALSGGSGSLTTSALGPGTHTVTAVYAGDALNAGSTAAALTQAVGEDATTTTLVSSANPSPLGQSVTFTATVAVATPGAGTPTGIVTFKDGNTVLASVPLVNGVATLTRSNLTQGAHTITAAYGGDANDQGSTSAALAQDVQAGSRISLTSSRNNSKFGRPVSFTATIATVAPGTGVATGLVVFYDGNVVIGTATLNSQGVAVFSTSTLSRGTHKIYAVYGGDSGHQAVTSGTITEMIS